MSPLRQPSSMLLLRGACRQLRSLFAPLALGLAWTVAPGCAVQEDPDPPVVDPEEPDNPEEPDQPDEPDQPGECEDIPASVEEPNCTQADAYPLQNGLNPGFHLVTRDVDWFQLSVTERAFVTIDFETEAGTFLSNHLEWSFYDAAGTRIVQNTFLNYPTFERVLDPGTYAIELRAGTPVDSKYTDDYRYSLTLATGPVPTGSISGRVVASFEPASAHGIPPGAELLAGEAVVKLRPRQGMAAAQVARMLASALDGHSIQSIGNDVLLVTAGHSSAAGQAVPRTRQVLRTSQPEARDTLALLARLRANPDVEYAQPNYLRRALAVPDDELYQRQWHYPLIGLEQAWDLTRGNPEVAVAIIDTGLVPDHPDLSCGRILPGHDFVDDDADPDDSASISGFHGTHVLGTVGACTSNGIGVAGVSNSSLIPIRVLNSEGSGTDVDVARGIRWAAGLEVPGAPRNPHPAAVINMSLGGEGYSQLLQDAIDEATAAGTITVVAAGNSTLPAHDFSPAGLDNVITVGAVGPSRDITFYSNFGPAITVMAPGGEQGKDPRDGVLSTMFDGGQFTYLEYQGTSMASPHVAGVVALMKAVKPDLDLAHATAYLRQTATPMQTAACREHGCGAGLVDAAAAVQAAASNAPIGVFLVGVPSRLDLGFESTTRTLTITNVGDAAGELTLASGAAALSVAVDQDRLAPGESAQVELRLDREGFTDGSFEAPFTIQAGNETRTMSVQFRVGAGIPDRGELVIELYRVVGGYEGMVYSQELQPFDHGYVFHFENLPDGIFGIAARTPSLTHASFTRVEVVDGSAVTDVLLELLENPAPPPPGDDKDRGQR